VTRAATGLLGLGLLLTTSAELRAQMLPGASSSPAVQQSAPLDGAPPRRSTDGEKGLTDLFGRNRVDRLLRSIDVEDRLRGLERAAAAHTSDALALLLGFRDDGEGATGDPRVLLALVRGLAGWVERPAARAVLVAIVRSPGSVLPVRPIARSLDPVESERQRVARVALARDEAALALARSGHPDAIKSLLDIVRDSDAGQEAASEALVAFPPQAPTSLATVELITAVGDLRLGAMVLSAARSSDAGLRAASLKALASSGDPRAAVTARAWHHDPELRVRIAAAETLVRLGDADAASAVEELVASDETVDAGLRLAQRVQDEGVTKAAAARAVASGNIALRLAALAALAHQTSGSALGALVTLASDPSLSGPAADGLARSPSASAIGAIEELSTRAASRRVAARAYFVRRYTRGERSVRLDALVDELAGSRDARDRAVAQQVRVGLGESPVEAAWVDPDARVRRAAALGSMGRLDTSTATAMLRRLAIEPDEVTRIVLAGALALGDRQTAPSTSDLVSRVKTGQPDAPVAALALAQRSNDAQSGILDALLASSDPFVRGHALRGLGASTAPNAAARLAAAYLWEEHAEVRRAIVEALAGRVADRTQGVCRYTLDLAARLDPDPEARGAARRALGGMDPARLPTVREVAWVALAPVEGAVLPGDVTALVVSSDGMGIPIAFDDDGFALIPGVTPGEAHLRLAARLAPYSPGIP
jgi:HEAT repeat protein